VVEKEFSCLASCMRCRNAKQRFTRSDGIYDLEISAGSYFSN